MCLEHLELPTLYFTKKAVVGRNLVLRDSGLIGQLLLDNLRGIHSFAMGDK